MASAVARFVWSLLLRLTLPLWFARFWWRGRKEPLYRAHWGERLGGCTGAPGHGRLWLHAVSLGETKAAQALVDALRRARPGLRLLLTHGTASGREAGIALLKEGDVQAWLPIDTPGAVRRFLDCHRPAIGVLMETELWPNLLHEAARRGVPMVLANARLSAQSLAKGRRTAALLGPAVRSLARVLAQTDVDAARLRSAGGKWVQVQGNLKFDLNPNPKLLARGLEWRQLLPRPVVLMANAREGEDAPLLKAWKALPEPRPLLVIVPRHPQRFDRVAERIAAAGFTLARRSGWTERPPVEAAAADVWLGDSLGEMALYYGMADAALLGGSFARLGGHNLIEAAACGCPLVMGRHTFNFALAAEQSLAARASVRATNLRDAVTKAVGIVIDPQRNAMVQRALDFAAQHRGAAARMARSIVELLPR